MKREGEDKHMVSFLIVQVTTYITVASNSSDLFNWYSLIFSFNFKNELTEKNITTYWHHYFIYILSSKGKKRQKKKNVSRFFYCRMRAVMFLFWFGLTKHPIRFSFIGQYLRSTHRYIQHPYFYNHHLRTSFMNISIKSSKKKVK